MSYWTDRQEQLKRSAEKSEEAIKKRLEKFYDAEYKRLEKEIATYYQNYGYENVIEYRSLLQSLPDEDITLLMERMDDFAEKYPQYANLMPVRESIYRLDRLQGLQYSVFMAEAEIAGYTEGQMRPYLTKLSQQGLNYGMETLGFGKNFYSINSDVVKQFVDAPWCNGENFSTRIWNDTQKLAQYLSTDIAQGFARGDSYDRLVRNVRQRFGRVNRKDAYRLIYTEGTYVMAESSMQPFTEDFENYRLSPVLDGKTCQICRGMREQVFEIKDRQPGVNFPPIHPWCRCTFEIVVEDWDKWMDDYVERHSGEKKQADKIVGKMTDGSDDDIIIQNPSEGLIDLEEYAKENNIDYRKVDRLSTSLSEEEIIEKISGGDMTEGSCSSLAFAYAGNKNGMNAIDFRGGKSRKMFALVSNIEKMANLSGVSSKTIMVKKEAAECAKIIEGLEIGKEYYFSAGKHAAIVRNTQGGPEYLELQSNRENGWKSFKDNIYGSIIRTLMKRFGCRKTEDKMKIGGKSIVFEKKVTIIDVDTLNTSEFRKMLGYLNTAEEKQMKGASGNVR